MTKKLRKLWHDLYYKKASLRRISFAMRCQAVTERYDVGQKSETLSERVRIQLHLSLCQACKDYALMSQALGAALRKASVPADGKPNLDKLNDALLNRFGSAEQSKKK